MSRSLLYRPSLHATGVALLLSALAAPLAAQANVPIAPSAPLRDTAIIINPLYRLQPAPVGLRRSPAVADSTLPAPRAPDARVGKNLALMGVGGAALIIGLLIGGDGGTVVAIAGGVVGLVGLYHYLR